LIVKKDQDFVEDLPDSIKNNQESIAATIENNVRRLIVEEMPTNPMYYRHMSEILDDLVQKRKQADLAYKDYLAQIIELTKQVRHPERSDRYPNTMNTPAKRALYDNLGQDEAQASAVDKAMQTAPADFRGNVMRERMVKQMISKVLDDKNVGKLLDLFEIIINQDEY
jgi:type I restriction enzyme R subunit